MKHQTAKQSKHGMRFFTPDLFVRFNSADDAVADIANDEWERALAGYRSHLKQIWKRIPNDVRKLSKLNLHEAELLHPGGGELLIESRFPQRPPAIFFGAAILSLRNDDQSITLVYALSKGVVGSNVVAKWPFSKDRIHWLYDEIDLSANHGFVHRILLSDGHVLEIPFVSVNVHITPWHSATPGLNLQMIAS